MARFLLLLAAAAIPACNGGPAAPLTRVTGTWGGDNAGLIATDSTAHVHIGCTRGDTDGPIELDSEGRFDLTGEYNVDAYPIDRGILHPARFTGRVVRRTMIISVALSDTTLQLGPVILTFGEEPRMGPCPICRAPEKRTATQ